MFPEQQSTGFGGCLAILGTLAFLAVAVFTLLWAVNAGYLQ